MHTPELRTSRPGDEPPGACVPGDPGVERPHAASTERYWWRLAKALGWVLAGISVHLWMDDPRPGWLERAQLTAIDRRLPGGAQHPNAGVVPRPLLQSGADASPTALTRTTDAVPAGGVGSVGTSGRAASAVHDGVAERERLDPSHDAAPRARWRGLPTPRVVRTGGPLQQPDAGIPRVPSRRVTAAWSREGARPLPVAVPEPSAKATSREPAAATAPAAGLAPIDVAIARVDPVVPHEREEDSILQVLREYETAVGRRDPMAAKAVWPTLDDRALARAFNGLEAHSLALEGCGVTVANSAARARCHGVASSLPKVGRRKPINASHEWTFNLSKTGGDWQIESAAIR